MPRRSVNVTDTMKKLIEEYQEKNGISTFEGAMWTLVRLGLEASKK